MTVYDLLKVMGNYGKYIQVGYKGKRSGIMKVGNVTFKHLDHWCYRKHILSITPCRKQGKELIYIHLAEDGNDR